MQRFISSGAVTLALTAALMSGLPGRAQAQNRVRMTTMLTAHVPPIMVVTPIDIASTRAAAADDGVELIQSMEIKTNTPRVRLQASFRQSGGVVDMVRCGDDSGPCYLPLGYTAAMPVHVLVRGLTPDLAARYVAHPEDLAMRLQYTARQDSRP